MSRKQTGNIGEELTVKYLEKCGYEIICRNYTIKGGEIDIIARKDDIIAFVEVKSRAFDSYEPGVTAVTKHKQRLIIRASAEYLYRTNTLELQPRFDVAQVTMEGIRPVKLDYFPDAFCAEGDETII